MAKSFNIIRDQIQGSRSSDMPSASINTVISTQLRNVRWLRETSKRSRTIIFVVLIISFVLLFDETTTTYALPNTGSISSRNNSYYLSKRRREEDNIINIKQQQQRVLLKQNQKEDFLQDEDNQLDIIDETKIPTFFPAAVAHPSSSISPSIASFSSHSTQSPSLVVDKESPTINDDETNSSASSRSSNTNNNNVTSLATNTQQQQQKIDNNSTSSSSPTSENPTTSPYPSLKASSEPSVHHSIVPSESPTYLPTLLPSKSLHPSTSPTDSLIPTISPSSFPSSYPTDLPSFKPSQNPSVYPSISFTPSSVPTHTPTKSIPTVSMELKPFVMHLKSESPIHDINIFLRATQRHFTNVFIKEANEKDQRKYINFDHLSLFVATDFDFRKRRLLFSNKKEDRHLQVKHQVHETILAPPPKQTFDNVYKFGGYLSYKTDIPQSGELTIELIEEQDRVKQQIERITNISFSNDFTSTPYLTQYINELLLSGVDVVEAQILILDDDEKDKNKNNDNDNTASSIHESGEGDDTEIVTRSRTDSEVIGAAVTWAISATLLIAFISFACAWTRTKQHAKSSTFHHQNANNNNINNNAHKMIMKSPSNESSSVSSLPVPGSSPMSFLLHQNYKNNQGNNEESFYHQKSSFQKHKHHHMRQYKKNKNNHHHLQSNPRLLQTSSPQRSANNKQPFRPILLNHSAKESVTSSITNDSPLHHSMQYWGDEFNHNNIHHHPTHHRQQQSISSSTTRSSSGKSVRWNMDHLFFGGASSGTSEDNEVHKIKPTKLYKEDQLLKNGDDTNRKPTTTTTTTKGTKAKNKIKTKIKKRQKYKEFAEDMQPENDSDSIEPYNNNRGMDMIARQLQQQQQQNQDYQEDTTQDVVENNGNGSPLSQSKLNRHKESFYDYGFGENNDYTTYNVGTMLM